MKRIPAIITALILVVILILTACSTAAPAPTTRPSTSAAPTQTYRPPSPSTAAPRPTTTAAPASPAPAPTAKPSPSGKYPVPAPTFTIPPITTPGAAAPSPTIGLATGGAKDVINFRENIRNKYLPLPTDITYEGLFYDYYFDTGATEPSQKLFSPSYSYAVTRDPLSHQTEYYMAVGLNSGLKESDFQRKKLNLVIVMDTSGSMGENYNQYYYDNLGKRVDIYAEEGIQRLRKIDSTKESVLDILDQLGDGDSLSIVEFNSNASVPLKMTSLDRLDMRQVQNYVTGINAGGSTNLAAGMDLATAQFRNLRGVNSYDYENRIIVLTDAQPNTGDYSGSGLMNIVARNADSRIYTTFIGIGVDFNTQLIELISKTRGANYYAVHSPRQFRERVEQEFDYMVTPLVFNVQLNFASRGWRIEKVFGSPEADQSTGNLMSINTLFPSKSQGGETKGGLVLLKLRKTFAQAEDLVTLTVNYEDRSGRRDGSQATIALEGTQPEYFDNSGIRKGILLTRYAALLKNWIGDQRQHAYYYSSWEPCIDERTGIAVPPENVGPWERTSLPLAVSSPYKRVFADFNSYFQSEMNAIGDRTLSQEVAILNTLSR